MPVPEGMGGGGRDFLLGGRGAGAVVGGPGEIEAMAAGFTESIQRIRPKHSHRIIKAEGFFDIHVETNECTDTDTAAQVGNESTEIENKALPGLDGFILLLSEN